MDYTPKQAAHYLHNMTSILADSIDTADPGSINYSVIDQPATVHDLLLQKSDGKFELVVWGERFTGGSDNVTINLGKSFSTVRIFDPTVGWP